MCATDDIGDVSVGWCCLIEFIDVYGCLIVRCKCARPLPLS